MIELARHPKIVPDPNLMIFSDLLFNKLQRLERGPTAGGVAYEGELYRHYSHFLDNS